MRNTNVTDLKYTMIKTTKNTSTILKTLITNNCLLSITLQVALCVPEDDGITVHCPTQWVDLTQTAVAQTLNYPAQRLVMFVILQFIKYLRD